MAVGDPCGCNQYRVAEYEPGRYMFQRLNTIWQQFCWETWPRRPGRRGGGRSVV